MRGTAPGVSLRWPFTATLVIGGAAGARGASAIATIESFFPTLLVAAGVCLALWVTHRVLARERAGRDRLIRQGALLVVGNLGLVAVILVLPLAEETRRQLLALLGLVLSAAIALSSTTLVGNAMAGVMLRVVGNFRPGDFIRVGDHFGRVSERGLFHVEIQTEDRDLTTLPNLFVVTHPVKVVRSSGTILTATLSLGYDQHHARVERLLVEAAKAAGLEDPFVWITELGNDAVTYRAAGLLRDVKELLGARSRLHATILDTLHEAGVEIVSPAFMNQRRIGEMTRFIPPRDWDAAPPAGTGGDEQIEQVIFDKAEQAQAREELASERDGLSERIAALKKERSAAASEEER
ncbi:MAG: mechanosensitive ion channel family protein, partial [Deltaproteobacteria bacterium]